MTFIRLASWTYRTKPRSGCQICVANKCEEGHGCYKMNIQSSDLSSRANDIPLSPRLFVATKGILTRRLSQTWNGMEEKELRNGGIFSHLFSFSYFPFQQSGETRRSALLRARLISEEGRKAGPRFNTRLDDPLNHPTKHPSNHQTKGPFYTV